MKLYFWNNDQDQHDTPFTTQVSANENGNLAEQFAAVLDTFAKHARYLFAAKEKEQLFKKLMMENAFTAKLLMMAPVDLSVFQQRHINRHLAKHFILLPDTLKPIPVCPIGIEPITYGVRFASDPNWYELNNIYQWVVTTAHTTSPMNRSQLIRIVATKQFNPYAEPLEAQPLLKAKYDTLLATTLLNAANQAPENYLSPRGMVALQHCLHYLALINSLPALYEAKWLYAIGIVALDTGLKYALPTVLKHGFFQRAVNTIKNTLTPSEIFWEASEAFTNLMHGNQHEENPIPRASRLLQN